MRISDWSSDVCSSDLPPARRRRGDPGDGAVAVVAEPRPRPGGADGLRGARHPRPRAARARHHHAAAGGAGDPGRPAPGRRRAGAVGDAVDAPPPARTAVSTEAPLAIPEEPLAVSVLTGFLGSGKTTLLRHLLAHPAMEETAVIVNEFGEIGLDHLLVQQAAEDTVLLNSGCLCCTVRGDLVAGMRDLYKRRVKGEVPAFQRLVSETTGLADPAPILQTIMTDPLLAERFRLDGVITTVDATVGAATLDRHSESVKQAAVADRLLLTKSDLADAAARAALEAQIGRAHV